MAVKMKAKKAIFFIFDAILAAGIILTGLILASSFYIFEGPTVNLNYFAEDTLRVLSALKVSEVNESYVTQLINDGSIARLNNTLLEQIGEFWAERDLERALNLSRVFIEDYVDALYGYGLYIDVEQIYLRDKPQPRTVISSRKMISGLTKNRTREGYVARATASKVKKNITDVFVFNPQGSEHGPGQGGRLRVTKLFNLDAEQISFAKLTLAIHTGQQLNTQSKFWVNGNQIDYDDINWIYEGVNSPEAGGTKVSYGETEDDEDDDNDLVEYLQNGWNNVTLELFGQPGYHTHLHPGSKVIVTYATSINKEVNKTITNRVYFDDTLSKASNKEHGAWQIVPFYIPKFVTLKNVTIHIQGKEIDNISNKDNIQVYLNQQTLDLRDPPCSSGQTCHVNLTYYLNATSVNTGTNVLSVYFNSYPDDFWSKTSSNTEIYSNPKQDPGGSSYVEVTYEFSDTDKRLKYGKIDVRTAKEFQEPDNYTNALTLNLSNLDIFESFVELTTLDTSNVTIKANNEQVFRTPRPLATPSRTYIDPDFLIAGMNTIRATDDCQTCEHFWVLNKTLFSYIFYVPSLVGYGKSFDKEADAIADAKQRLKDVLGPYVDAVEINEEVLTLSRVPTLWGPAIVEMRVWQ